MADLPIILFETPADMEQWLEDYHQSSDGFWLKIAKKDSGHVSVSYAEGLDIALCFGWIDSQKKGFDDKFFLQKFTPRRARSKWSKINVNKVTALIEQGKMREAGLREIEAAKSDGRWDAAYEGAKTIQVPADFQQLLDANPEAKAFFETLNSANRYAILFRLHDAKRPETRQKRLNQYITMLNEKKKILE